MLTDTAERILRRKYYLQGEDFEGLCLRVANFVASKETDRKFWTSKYFQLINELWFIPGGRILANSGISRNGNMFNCTTLGINDSRASIYQALKRSADIFAHGGGIGYNFSNLREYEAPVSNGSRASGPLSFMRLFDTSAEIISQASRRGAQMGILNVNHPDIEAFIGAKNTEGDFSHFNFSVGVTDKFMEAVENNESFDLISRYDSSIAKSVDALELFESIAALAWRTGDPGVLFIDAMERDNATPFLGKLEATNPCGEIPLLPGESCCLGAINLTKMIGDGAFEEERLTYAVTMAVRFLDSVHDVNVPVLPFLKTAAEKTRKIGLGVMGWADTLALLGIPYNAPEARELAHKIGSVMKKVAYTTSILLAEEKGPYGAYDPDKSRNIWFRDFPVTPTRNAMLLGFAPTGTISLLAGVNSSIEPFYALSYIKRITEGTKGALYNIQHVNKYLLDSLTSDKLEVVKKYLKTHGSIQGMKDLDWKTKELFVTAHDIHYDDHIDMQAAWQENVCGSISKTINLPEDATVEDVKQAIMTGWKVGLKGMTLFRNNCRLFQIMVSNSG